MKNSTKWFLILYSHDHGFQSAEDEGIIYDDLESILRNNSGAKYIMSELQKWRNSYYRNDEEYVKLNDLIKHVNYDVAIKNIVNRAKKDPNEEQYYYLDSINGTECGIKLRIANEFDVDLFPNAKDVTINETNMKKTAKKVDEGFGDNRISIPTDLSLKKGSAAYIIKNNLDAINACTSKEELIDLMNKLFDEGKLDMGHRKDFPWRNKFFYRLERARDLGAAQKIVYDAMLKGQGLGVIYEDEKDNKKDKACESKKQYTKKQITEAIAYWKKQLKKMNESSVIDGIYTTTKFSEDTPDFTAELWIDSYEWGIKKSDNFLDIFRQWKREIEKYYADNGFNVEVISMEGPAHYDDEFSVGLKCRGNCEGLDEFLRDNGQA